MASIPKFTPTVEQRLGVDLMRWSAGAAAVPDPIPLADEILFGTTFLIGGGLFIHGSYRSVNLSSVSSGGQMSPDSYRPITSTTGQSPRGKYVATNRATNKQIRSTSHKHSYRRKYYGKKRKYRY